MRGRRKLRLREGMTILNGGYTIEKARRSRTR